MLTFALIVAPALQLSGRAPASVPPALSMSASQSRRQLLKVGAVAALPVSSTPAFAEEFNRMAGVIEPFTEVQKGFKLYKPVAWNQVRARPGLTILRGIQNLQDPPFCRPGLTSILSADHHRAPCCLTVRRRSGRVRREVAGPHRAVRIRLGELPRAVPVRFALPSCV